MTNFDKLIGHKVLHLYADDGDIHQSYKLWMMTDKGEYTFEPEGDCSLRG